MGLTLDAGALIALERRDAKMLALLREPASWPIRVPAGVLAQVLRPGGRQNRIFVLLGAQGTAVVPLDERVARLAAVLLASSRTTDVVDASVVVCATLNRDTVVTSDPGDLRRLEPRLPMIAV